jgi:hypothetical protein
MTEKEIKQRNKHRNTSGSLEILNPHIGVRVNAHAWAHTCVCAHSWPHTCVHRFKKYITKKVEIKRTTHDNNLILCIKVWQMTN